LITVGLISDTHSYLGEDVIKHLTDCDEVWHAGDIGDMATADAIHQVSKTIRMVWGNIDDNDLRLTYPKDLVFTVEGLKVYITHIGGYPSRYYKKPLEIIKEEQPGLFISGHSHILKVMPDKKYNLLHMNPGACGNKGFHTFRTFLKFEISERKVQNLRAIDLGKRGKID
jgi:putative phosphoesterase